MLQLNWFGKFLLAKKAIEFAGDIVDKRAAKQYEDDTFTESELQELARAVRNNDYAHFRRVYRFRRSWADDDNVDRSYELVRRSL